MRGQGYDNGANMSGKHKGVQTRFLEMNPRAFFTPCGCHSLNLALADAANCCTKASSFFGGVQSLYSLFASSTKRWAILLKYVKVKGYTLKTLSVTRWESRYESVKAIIVNAPGIRDALLELMDTEDTKTRRDAETLITNELQNYEFLFAMVIWYNILGAVNSVSKFLQKEDMQIDLAIDLLRGLIETIKDYRDTGFEKFKVEAEKIAEAMGIEPIFVEKRIIRRKRQFDETDSEEPRQSALESFRINYFLYVVDQVLTSLDSRFAQFKSLQKTFGFLFNVDILKQANDESLKNHCVDLESFLTHGGSTDLDGRDLYHELKVLRQSLSEGAKRAIDVLQHLRGTNGIAYPNAWIAYRILLTIPVTVASAERSFSKLKLIKSYLRSTMSQDRLNALATLSIENELAEKINYENVISIFANKYACRFLFK